MDAELFLRACEDARAYRARKEPSGIGTLAEQTLHAAIKRYFDPDGGGHEAKIGRYVADVVGEDGIVEIQTANFDKLRKKLASFLSAARVTVVYPIAHEKWITWVEPSTGEPAARVKSPKRGAIYDALPELYKIKMLLKDPNLRFRLLLIDMVERRALDGRGPGRKIKASRLGREPVALVREIEIGCPCDYLQFLPPKLPDLFTTEDLSREARLRGRLSWLALHILCYVGVTELVGKRGRRHLYRRALSAGRP